MDSYIYNNNVTKQSIIGSHSPVLAINSTTHCMRTTLTGSDDRKTHVVAENLCSDVDHGREQNDYNNILYVLRFAHVRMDIDGFHGGSYSNAPFQWLSHVTTAVTE